MLHYGVVFLVIAAIAAAVGLGTAGGTTEGIASTLSGVFAVLAMLSLAAGPLRQR